MQWQRRESQKPTRPEDDPVGDLTRTEEGRGGQSTEPNPEGSRVGRTCSAECDEGGRTIGPELGRSRPIRAKVEPARLEAEVYESQHTVGAGEREKEVKRAQGL